MVSAAGLKAEAESKANTPLSFLDASTIPAELRGYVSVAVSRGFTRGELAHAIALIQNRAVQ
jgi:hypothetical protein